MKLVSIPKDKYEKYRLDILFDGYKWDPQFLDNNTIAKHILVLSRDESDEIERITEKLTEETINSENVCNNNLKITNKLALPRQTQRMLKRMSNYQPEKHIRLMRFDFHPVVNGGFEISEVNSDVPGGFAEASIMPEIAARLFTDKKYTHKNFSEIMTRELAKKSKPGGNIAFVHCTSYSDDRQMMQFLGDKLREMGYQIIYCAADHIKFENQKAICILDNYVCELDVVFRFTPLEWLIGMKKTWHGYFDTVTASCNHPACMFTQTKRFPLIWDKLESLNVDLSAWRKYLPETLEVKDAAKKNGYIFKPACGRVGEGISIREACSSDEYTKIIKDVKRHPKQYLAQKMFISRPLPSEDGNKYHVCLGAYSVEGKAAGFYARISKTPRIDSNASDIPVLIED